jgi:type IV secretory pathway VirJ component
MQGKRPIIILTLLAALVAAGIGVRRLTRPPDAATAAPVWTPVTQQVLRHGRFDPFTVYSPHDTPRGFVLLLSGADGWNQALSDLGIHLGQEGALVAGIDFKAFSSKLEADGADCVFPDGDLENLSHFVQAYYHLPTYLPPILAGVSAGATLAYAALAQAPANTFAAAVSLGFCPTLALRKPLCKSGALDFTRPPGVGDNSGVLEFRPAAHLSNPWLVLDKPDAAVRDCDAATADRFVGQVPGARLVPEAGDSGVWPPAYAATFDALLAENAPAPAAGAPAALADLPIVPVAAQSGAPATDTFAIMLSGDGGWAGLDKDVAAALTADGIGVVGLDSLRYFWSARTPQGLAADLERMIRYYLAALGKRRVMLIGYSQGADVLPFAVNRLSAETRARVALVAVMGMSEHALFEFHMTSWVSDDDSGPATLPEVDKIAGIPVLCIYGEQETDSLCPKLDPHKATVVKLKGGHHFDGNYAGLAHTILASARP